MTARFIRLSGPAAMLPGANVDTDVIMPKTFLKGIDRAGLAVGLFHDLRFDDQGRPRPGFVLNAPAAAGVRFLICGANFGCGSSREHAVWGMLQFGIRAILAPSFGAIFADNAANNGLLLLPLPAEQLGLLAERLPGGIGAMTIDLEQQIIDVDGHVQGFAMDEAARQALMAGADRIAQTLAHADAIRAFEADYFAQSPWLAP